VEKINFNFVYNPSTGLGDCLSCFNTNRAVWSPSPHFATIKKYSSIQALDTPEGPALLVPSLHEIDFGSEHLFNRVRIASGLEPLTEPRAQLDLIDYRPVRNRVAFSFDVGQFAQNQTFLHPRPRQLYPEHRATIQEFISKNCDQFDFIEIGTNSFVFENTISQVGVGLEQTIDLLSQCQFYFGMHSGLMHLATAVGVRSTIIINFPTVARLTKLSAFDPQDRMEWEKMWLYPQHQYLHEDETSTEYAITVETLESKVCGL
jgi:hypothetical protein